MITLASIIKTFVSDFMTQYQDVILPSQGRALAVMQDCRSSQSPHLLAQCSGCDKQVFMPHSCGHRNCPHCQSHESQQWLERQLKKQVPADYFLITFTVPKSLRSLVWQHQKLLYDMMLACVWQTVKDFAKN
ncbi:MAG: transposase zinc-binding domain-containing protein, partial [Nitrospirota bacterium]|nr:transposase zinc-binding domain-containing protein [Nitrospirota bacterium]